MKNNEIIQLIKDIHQLPGGKGTFTVQRSGKKFITIFENVHKKHRVDIDFDNQTYHEFIRPADSIQHDIVSQSTFEETRHRNHGVLSEWTKAFDARGINREVIL